MAIVRKLGKPDLFITMTANPHWAELDRELKESGQTVWDRPYLVNRVFQTKLKELIKIVNSGYFGKVNNNKILKF